MRSTICRKEPVPSPLVKAVRWIRGVASAGPSFWGVASCPPPSLADRASGQEPSGPQAAAAMEKVLADAIARAEKSVVAIARVRKEQAGETVRFEFRPDAFARQPHRHRFAIGRRPFPSE